jgi:hypothetical protein
MSRQHNVVVTSSGVGIRRAALRLIAARPGTEVAAVDSKVAGSVRLCQDRDRSSRAAVTTAAEYVSSAGDWKRLVEALGATGDWAAPATSPGTGAVGGHQRPRRRGVRRSRVGQCVSLTV